MSTKFLLSKHQKVSVLQLYIVSIQRENRYPKQNGKLVYSDIFFLLKVRGASSLVRKFENVTEMEIVRATIVVVFIAGTCKNQFHLYR